MRENYCQGIHQLLATHLSDWESLLSRHSKITWAQNDVKLETKFAKYISFLWNFRVFAFRIFFWLFHNQTTHQRSVLCDISLHTVCSPENQETRWYCVPNDLKILAKRAIWERQMTMFDGSISLKWRKTTKIYRILNFRYLPEMTQNYKNNHEYCPVVWNDKNAFHLKAHVCDDVRLL